MSADHGHLYVPQDGLCTGCRSPIPAGDDHPYTLGWVAHDVPGNEVGILCPGCITGAQQRELEEDLADLNGEDEEYA